MTLRSTAPILVRVGAVTVAMVVAVLVLWAFGAAPGVLLRKGILDSFATSYGLAETLVKATPLVLCALAVSVPASAGLFNIGAEGQFYMGAVGATGAVILLGDLGPLTLPVMFVSAVMCGGFWAAGAGALRAYLRVSEVMVTLLGNFIAALLVDFLVHGPWKDASSFGWPQTAEFPNSARLATFGGSRAHFGIFLALVAAGICWVALRKTTVGFALRIIRGNPNMAMIARLDIAKWLVGALAVGGALAAVAGAAEVSAIQGRLRSGISPGYGYTAILVAWLAEHRPLAVVLVGFLIGGLMVGGDALQISANLPAATVHVFFGTVFLFVLAGNYVIARLEERRHAVRN